MVLKATVLTCAMLEGGIICLSSDKEFVVISR